MTDDFGFSKYTNHDFFHIRYGKGAVILAIEKGAEKSKIVDGKYPPLQIAQIFNSRDQKFNSPYPYFDPINKIEESGGFVRLEIEFERRFDNNRDYHPLISVVERTIPATHVTFEIIK